MSAGHGLRQEAAPVRAEAARARGQPARPGTLPAGPPARPASCPHAHRRLRGHAHALPLLHAVDWDACGGAGGPERPGRAAQNGAPLRGSLAADGPGDVHGHVGAAAAVADDRARHGAAQDDPRGHDRAWRRRLARLHGQRVRAPRVDRLPQARGRLSMRRGRGAGGACALQRARAAPEALAPSTGSLPAAAARMRCT